MTDTLTTDRLTLRRPMKGDEAQLVALAGNLNVSKWLTRVPHPYTPEDARAFIDSQSDEVHHYVICLEDEVIGGVGAKDQLGYWLGEPYWGRGYITEATEAVTEDWFAKGRDILPSGYFVDNAGSKRVLTKLGFEPTHIVDAESIATGKTHRLQKMMLLRSKWEGR